MNEHDPRAARPYAEVHALMSERAHIRRNPFAFTVAEEVDATLDTLASTEPAAWANAFTRLMRRHRALAEEARDIGDRDRALSHYLTAYDYGHVARFPAPNAPAKTQAYREAQLIFQRAGELLDPVVENVRIRFAGRLSESNQFPGYLRRPACREPAPTLVSWGGIDSFKEERAAQAGAFLDAGLAVLAIDMPGVGDAPIAGAPDAERLWDAVLDWIAGRDDLDERRVAFLGASTGGYWAAKLAHTHRRRVRAVVDHGGPTHFAFQEKWIESAQRGEYPWELAETLACAFGGCTYDDWIRIAPGLSLLELGVLDEPCAPLLLVNGTADTIFPITDMYLLLEHGSAKYARFTPGVGHMGASPSTMPTIVSWLSQQLS